MSAKQTSRICSVIITLFILLSFSSGCRDNKKEPVIKEKIQKVEEVKKEPEKIVYKEEIYGDPEIFSKPRLQFAWQAPMEKEKTIWSSNLDGSDLRRVLSPELLFKFNGVIAHLPVRSPDNRYLAVSLDTLEVMGTIKILFDLKEKTVTKLGKGGFVPHFQWTSNSEFLYYYNEGGFWKYNVKSKKNIKIPVIYSRGLYILNDDRFVALHINGYSVHSKERKEIFRKKITGGGISSTTQAVSKDGKLIFCQIAYNKKGFNTIFKLNNPDDIIYKSFERNISHAAFGPENKKLYFSQGVVEYLDLETKETKEVFRMPERSIVYLTIFNVKKNNI